LVVLLFQLVQAAPVSISGRKILINSQPFFARGAAYSPVPVPSSPGALDLFSNANSAYWSGDLDSLKAMGANTIRIYTDLNEAGPYDAFLNKCVTNKIYVILNYYVNGDISNTTFINTCATGFSNMVKRYTGHPAVLAFALGNEENNANWSPSQVANFLKIVFAQARPIQSVIPLTTTFADNNLAGFIPASDAYVDFWCLQIYRGASFYNLFTTYSTWSNKPLIITEYGLDAYSQTKQQEDPTTQSLWGTNLVKEIEQNSVWNTNNPGVASGGLVFEYTDEWWKYTDPTAHNSGGNADAQYPDGYANPEYYGIVAIGPGTPNTRAPRTLYTSMKTMWTTCAYPANAHPDNQILNSNFLLGVQFWNQVAYNGASFLLDTSSSYLAVTNIIAGSAGYTGQIQYLNLNFQAGTSYSYSFDACTLDGSTRTLFHYFETNWPPLSGNGSPYTTTITSAWTTYKFTFASTLTTSTAHLAFEIGNAPLNSFALNNVYLSGGTILGDSTLSTCTKTAFLQTRESGRVRGRVGGILSPQRE